MERDFAGVHLSENDFRRLSALCPNDPRMPKDYAQWEALVREGARLTHAEGRTSTRIDVDLDHFSAWCYRIGIQIGFDALRAYLIVQRRYGIDPQGSAGTQPTTATPPKRQGPKRVRGFSLGLGFPLPLAAA
jgi:anti-sigma factor RsiW